MSPKKPWTLGDLEARLDTDEPFDRFEIKRGFQALLNELDELRESFDGHRHTISDHNVTFDVSSIDMSIDGETDEPS